MSWQHANIQTLCHDSMLTYILLSLPCVDARESKQADYHKLYSKIHTFFLQGTATKQCMNSSQWFFNQEKNSTWTNYTLCNTDRFHEDITDTHGIPRVSSDLVQKCEHFSLVSEQIIANYFSVRQETWRRVESKP